MGLPIDAAVADAAVVDAALADAAVDASRPDAAATIDASPIDASPADAAIDASPADAAVDAAPAADAAPHDPLAIRFVSANLTSGNNQRYEGPGTRILAALRPDVVLVQELNVGDNQPNTLRTFVDTTFGSEYSFFRESATGIPNGVVSRYPILAAGVIDDPTLVDREFVWARLDVPGDRDLWAVSVHFKASAGDAGTRHTEAVALAGALATMVPAADYLVIAGDLNTQSSAETCMTDLAAVVTIAEPFPADQQGDHDTNGGRNHPYDWVLFDADLDALEVPVALGGGSFADGLVFDTRVFTPVIAPALAGDSGAAGMQHMAVVRDVRLPAR